MNFDFMIPETTREAALVSSSELRHVSDSLWATLRRVRLFCSRTESVTMHGRSVLDMLRDVQDQLALYFSLEERLSGQEEDAAFPAVRLGVSPLQSEHAALFADLRDLLDHAEKLFYSQRLTRFASYLRLRFAAFNDQLRAHEQREAELMMEAFDRDIGAGD